ncbi:MAG: 30S ribosomal protein S16 [Bacteroidia bacterium]|nr:30S ribosomal protein S16 [Bacteroidia bacterium]
MATKIRLQRHGRKGRPIFHVVVADSRAPRDGRYIEKLGIYNPNTNPATVDINFDRTLGWLQKGAELTDTSRAILSYKGILHKNHLLNGVKKGALTTEQVEEKFNQWLESKEAKISGKVNSIADSKQSNAKANLERETKLKEAKAAKIMLKNSELAAEVDINTETTEENTKSEDTIETSAETTENVVDTVSENISESTEVSSNEENSENTPSE